MKTTEQLQNEISKKFPNIQLLEDYKGANVKILTRCNDCGYEWRVIPRSVAKSKCGCPKCGKAKALFNKSLNYFLNKYDKNLYELIEFKDCFNVTVKCKKCGCIRTTTANNIYRYGCPKCGHERTAQSERLSQFEFLQRCKEIHGDKYDYSEAIYVNWTTPVKIICPIHGEFWLSPGKHISGQNCPKCNQSRGEEIIANILKKYNYIFESQFNIENPFGKRNFRIDFKINKNGKIMFVEFNGRQHYEPVDHFGGGGVFEKQCKRDSELRKYCKENKIPLLEIKYDCKNIEKELLTFITAV